MNSGRIDEYDLASLCPFLMCLLLANVANIDDSKNAVARGLRLGRNDGQLLAHQGIQERALARVGAAENADESGVEGHEDRVLGSGYQHRNLPNHMDSDVNFEVLPGFIGGVDRSMESSSQRQTGTVPEGQTERTGLSHEIAGNSRLLCSERHGIVDRAKRILPCFIGIASATHQLCLYFG